jgi:acetyl-CoA synthetase
MRGEEKAVLRRARGAARWIAREDSMTATMKTDSNGVTIYPPSRELASSAHVDWAGYQEKYAASVADPDAFWGAARQAARLDQALHEGQEHVLRAPNVSIKWFEDGTLNVAANCVDRHLATRGDQTAIIWEPDDPKEPAKHITYRELHRPGLQDGQHPRGHGRPEG